jgi:hypothetical protein
MSRCNHHQPPIQEIMSQPTTEQIEALKRLWIMAQRDHGGARVVLRVLLGCYNGGRFPFDLTDLRLLDSDVLRDVITVLGRDSRPWKEVHELLNDAFGRRDIGPRQEILACDWRMKGKCSREAEKELRARLATAERAAA